MDFCQPWGLKQQDCTLPTGSRDSHWIVIAAYNEAERLGPTLLAVQRYGGPVVVVDDGSTDQTGLVAIEHGAWVLRHIVNCGQGAALQTGIDFALSHEAEIVVTFDADGQHSESDIATLVEPIVLDKADITLGSRFLGHAVGLPRSRWLVLKLGVLFTRIFSGVAVTDTHNGLRAMSRAAAQRIRISQNRMAHASEIIDQIRLHGLRYSEVPVTIRYSASTLEKGQSSWNALRVAGQLLLGKLLR
jgi:glycosyltransferase involved in cell wall biosynthesis